MGQRLARQEHHDLAEAEDDNYLVMGGEAMHRPTLLEGVLVALILSLSVSPLVVFVQLAIGSLLAWKIAVMVMAYTYMGYLLARSGSGVVR